jgi:dienelactone hydrolase
MPDRLPGTEPLVAQAGWMERIVEHWDTFFLAQIASAATQRPARWQRDPGGAEAYARSVSPNRERFRRYIGAVDERVTPSSLELVASLGRADILAEADRFRVHAARWQVLPGVYARGLLLMPRDGVQALVVALPDADQTPEMLAGLEPGVSPESQYVRRLAHSGAMVLIPALVDRQARWSGDERLGRFTNQTHREWIYRQAAEMGRHIIGYEVQVVSAVIDLLRAGALGVGPAIKVGVAGYGEGGLLALYAAAVDTRIEAAWVSGYFEPRERVWLEPLYRNVWGLLEEFGDAEIASLVAPRGLVVEHSRAPEVAGAVAARPGQLQAIAAAGRLTTPSGDAARREWQRAVQLTGQDLSRGWTWVAGPDEQPVSAGSERAIAAFSAHLGLSLHRGAPEPYRSLQPVRESDRDERQYRLVSEWQEHTQRLARLSEYEREQFFWTALTKIRSPDAWREALRARRDVFWREVIGKLPDPGGAANARTRRLPQYENARWTAYEVILDVYPGVSAWAYLLVPDNLPPGERRPVVVCQHGAGGNPASSVNRGADEPGFRTYQGYAAELADRGFVVLAPYNPNAAVGEPFRQLQRKANPLRLSIFSAITANHQRFLEWLGGLPFVDPARVGFYGLSYGGKTAVRVPALLEGYALSICSGDWNDYVPKMTSVRQDKNTFLYSVAYETIEFNLANTFNYAEMAALIAPRPFMVEHGYLDRVAALEWAAAEYARVRRLYFNLGVPERTAMAFFDGPHRIDGAETFPFLHRHLDWPEPTADARLD